MSHSKDRSLNDISLEYTYEELNQAGTIANEMDGPFQTQSISKKLETSTCRIMFVTCQAMVLGCCRPLHTLPYLFGDCHSY